jgi:hypothetical protein
MSNVHCQDIWWKNIMQVDECWNEQNWGGKRERTIEVKVWSCGCIVGDEEIKVLGRHVRHLLWWSSMYCILDAAIMISTEVGVCEVLFEIEFWWIWTFFWKWFILSHFFLSLVPISMLANFSSIEDLCLSSEIKSSLPFFSLLSSLIARSFFFKINNWDDRCSNLGPLYI